MGPHIAPVGQVAANRPAAGPLCDPIIQADIGWCTRFASFEEERDAFEGVASLFSTYGYRKLEFRCRALMTGCFIRAGLLREAEAHVRRLDESWPRAYKDGPLHEAYRRLMHVKTGQKDLALCFNTNAHRTAPLARLARMIVSRWSYCEPVKREC
jgi:hypothetical protein